MQLTVRLTLVLKVVPPGESHLANLQDRENMFISLSLALSAGSEIMENHNKHTGSYIVTQLQFAIGFWSCCPKHLTFPSSLIPCRRSIQGATEH